MKKRLLLLIPIIVLAGCFGNEETKTIEPIDFEIVDIVASDGCCVAGDSCASGVGVTRAYCVNELDGTYSATGACNDDNKCE